MISKINCCLKKSAVGMLIRMEFLLLFGVGHKDTRRLYKLGTPPTLIGRFRFQLRRCFSVDLISWIVSTFTFIYMQ